jgi:prolipoprotein diacylglyceryl transferase
MYPTISHIIQDIFGVWISLPLKTFGVFVALAMLLSVWVLGLELKRKENLNLIRGNYNKKGNFVRPHEHVSTLSLIIIVSSMVGARIFSILEYPAPFLEAPLYVLFSDAGFTYYGGLIFGGIAAIIYAKKINLRVIHLIDAAAPALLLGYAIGRMGCQLSGDGDWGIDNNALKPDWLGFMPNWFWAYNYPHNVINEGVSIPGCSGEYCSMLPTTVFPTPLYEILFCSLAFFVLWFFRGRIKTPGLMFGLYLVISGTERFLIEQIRVDAEYSIFSMSVKQAEFISFFIILTGIVMLWISLRKHYKHIFRYSNYLNNGRIKESK